MELRLLALYPDQMNIYADRGNILFLRKRCEWRGIEFEYAAAGPGERFDPAPTTCSTSAAARTATSVRWPPTWSRPSASRLPRRSMTAP